MEFSVVRGKKLLAFHMILTGEEWSFCVWGNINTPAFARGLPLKQRATYGEARLRGLSRVIANKPKCARAAMSAAYTVGAAFPARRWFFLRSLMRVPPIISYCEESSP